MSSARVLLLSAVLLCGSCSAQSVTQIRPLSLPVQDQAALSPQMVSIPATLATLSNSPEAVLFAPNLTRADVAEALRKAMLNQGTVVHVITTRAALYSSGGIAFHLALAGALIYLVKQPKDSLPFLATATLVAEGEGVSVPGVAYITTPQRGQALRVWAREITLRTKPVPLGEIVHTWIKATLHVNTR